MLQNVCTPAILYIVFSITQIIIDIFKNLYNTAFLKFGVMIVFAVALNLLCKRGLGIVSWFIVFVPFIMMTVVTTLLLIVFGLHPSEGVFDYSDRIMPMDDDEYSRKHLHRLQPTLTTESSTGRKHLGKKVKSLHSKIVSQTGPQYAPLKDTRKNQKNMNHLELERIMQEESILRAENKQLQANKLSEYDRTLNSQRYYDNRLQQENKALSFRQTQNQVQNQVQNQQYNTNTSINITGAVDTASPYADLNCVTNGNENAYMSFGDGKGTIWTPTTISNTASLSDCNKKCTSSSECDAYLTSQVTGGVCKHYKFTKSNPTIWYRCKEAIKGWGSWIGGIKSDVSPKLVPYTSLKDNPFAKTSAASAKAAPAAKAKTAKAKAAKAKAAKPAPAKPAPAATAKYHPFGCSKTTNTNSDSAYLNFGSTGWNEIKGESKKVNSLSECQINCTNNEDCDAYLKDPGSSTICKAYKFSTKTPTIKYSCSEKNTFGGGWTGGVKIKSSLKPTYEDASRFYKDFNCNTDGNENAYISFGPDGGSGNVKTTSQGKKSKLSDCQEACTQDGSCDAYLMSGTANGTCNTYKFTHKTPTIWYRCGETIKGWATWIGGIKNDVPLKGGGFKYQHMNLNPFLNTTIKSKAACIAAGGSGYNYCSDTDTHYCCNVCGYYSSCKSNSGLNACACTAPGY